MPRRACRSAGSIPSRPIRGSGSRTRRALTPTSVSISPCDTVSPTDGHTVNRHHIRPKAARSRTKATPSSPSNRTLIKVARILLISATGRDNAMASTTAATTGRTSKGLLGPSCSTVTATIAGRTIGDAHAVKHLSRPGRRPSSRWALRVRRSLHHQPAMQFTTTTAMPIAPTDRTPSAVPAAADASVSVFIAVTASTAIQTTAPSRAAITTSDASRKDSRDGSSKGGKSKSMSATAFFRTTCSWSSAGRAGLGGDWFVPSQDGGAVDRSGRRTARRGGSIGGSSPVVPTSAAAELVSVSATPGASTG